AYSDVLLAESLVNAARQSAKSGILPGRLIEERVNNRDNSDATLLTALESLTFTSNVSRRHAEAKVEDAQRRLRINQQQVRTLIGQSVADESQTEKVTQQQAARRTRPMNVCRWWNSVLRLQAQLNDAVFHPVNALPPATDC
ncbi:MAG: hypothetical protein O2856_17360, partial [Planctomycetota bacterium]|nr:hypothetical protein [Planctomycetota bacterium]